MELVVKAAVMSSPLFTRSNGIMIVMSKFIPPYYRISFKNKWVGASGF